MNCRCFRKNAQFVVNYVQVVSLYRTVSKTTKAVTLLLGLPDFRAKKNSTPILKAKSGDILFRVWVGQLIASIGRFDYFYGVMISLMPLKNFLVRYLSICWREHVTIGSIIHLHEIIIKCLII